MNICIAREEQQLVATKKGIKIKFIQYLIIFIFCSNNEHTVDLLDPAPCKELINY